MRCTCPSWIGNSSRHVRCRGIYLDASTVPYMALSRLVTETAPAVAPRHPSFRHTLFKLGDLNCSQGVRLKHDVGLLPKINASPLYASLRALMRAALKLSIFEHFRPDGEGGRVPGGRGGGSFFLTCVGNATISEPYASIVKSRQLIRELSHACLNRLRHRHHRCGRPRRLLSPRSGRDAATTQTWIERIGGVAFSFACNHLSPTANASPGRSSTGASLLARTFDGAARIENYLRILRGPGVESGNRLDVMLALP